MKATWLEVAANGRRYGLPAAHVVEVGEPRGVLPAPSALPAVRGVTEARGRLVPLLHLGAFLAGTAAPAARGTATVLVRAAGRPVCLEVDDAFAVLRGEVLPTAELPGLPFAQALARESGQAVPILDLNALGERLSGAGATA
ncbi:MAG TPA: chemotaxis protein CheW [Gemmatimonadales bacterium]|jgi:chemotaxis signal transduction protein|nr:chemotaxis protein CheW [Gemmatimonadales bacterium]